MVPITELSKKGHKLRRVVSTDAIFTVGETSVFYSTNIEFDPYLTAVYKDYFSNKKSNEANPEYWVREGYKYKIINSHVNYNGYYIPIDSFKVEIKKIADIVDKP